MARLITSAAPYEPMWIRWDASDITVTWDEQVQGQWIAHEEYRSRPNPPRPSAADLVISGRREGPDGSDLPYVVRPIEPRVHLFEGIRREPMNHLSGGTLEIDDNVETQRREVALVEG